MRKRRQREVWQNLGENDPDWAVLTERARRGGGWQDSLDVFYRRGEKDVEDALRMAAMDGGASALDYGAGSGRLSLALAQRFDRVVAVDISDAMLQTLRNRAAQAGYQNIDIRKPDDLGEEVLCDFAISLLVLQHLPSREDVRDALAGILGSLLPGGRAVIEVPDHARTLRARVQPRLRLYVLLRALGAAPEWLQRHGLSGISMLTLRRDWMARVLHDIGGEILATSMRPDADYVYVRYVLASESDA